MPQQTAAQQRVMQGMGQRLKAARRQAGLTQEALAEALERTQAEISHWERGLYAIPSYLLPTLTQLLRVPLETFYEAALLYRPSQGRQA